LSRNISSTRSVTASDASAAAITGVVCHIDN
jgi:hypothetical protein